jgi:predicted acetyltransferase
VQPVSAFQARETVLHTNLINGRSPSRELVAFSTLGAILTRAVLSFHALSQFSCSNSHFSHIVVDAVYLNRLDSFPMQIEVISASITDKPLIQQMMELYQYDFSEFENTDLNEHGYFGYAYLDYYWVEPDRHPFIVRVKGRLAGFALVNQFTYLPGSQYSIAEFFILRKYRRQGIGKRVAMQILNQFCGRWEIHQTIANIGAQKFWRHVIAAYTNGDFIETVIDAADWQGLAQCFESRSVLSSL